MRNDRANRVNIEKPVSEFNSHCTPGDIGTYRGSYPREFNPRDKNFTRENITSLLLAPRSIYRYWKDCVERFDAPSRSAVARGERGSASRAEKRPRIPGFQWTSELDYVQTLTSCTYVECE